MVWHMIRANILLIVNVIFTDGIRMFREYSDQKIEASLLIARIFLDPAELGKIQRNSQNIRTHYMLNHRIRCM